LRSTLSLREKVVAFLENPVGAGAVAQPNLGFAATLQRVARRVYQAATSAGPITPSLHDAAHLTLVKER